MEQLSVTITGLPPGTAEDDHVHELVADTAGLSHVEFTRRVLPRMPVSLEPTDLASASRRFQALVDLGVKCSLDEDDGRRYLFKDQDRICGPVSAGWLKKALRNGSINLNAQIRLVGDGTSGVSAAEWAATNGLDAEILGIPAAESKTAAIPPPGTDSPASLNTAEIEAMPNRKDRPGLYAGFWRRVLAYLIDALIIGVPIALIELIVRMVLINFGRGVVLLADVPLGLLGWLYFALMESSSRMATIGKIVVGLRVVGEHGARISFLRATGRYFGLLLTDMTFGIGFLICAWTRRKQATHDMISRTFVVRADGLDALRTSPVPVEPGTGLSTLGAVGVSFACVISFVLVTGVLAAISIPAYEDYIARAQVIMAFTETYAIQRPIGDYVAKEGRLPPAYLVDQMTIAHTNDPAVSKIFVRMVGNNVDIAPVFSNAAMDGLRGRYLIIDGSFDGTTLNWTCYASRSRRPISTQYLPKICQH